MPFELSAKLERRMIMVKKIVETVVGGSIGLLALYVVAHVAYDAGHKMAMAECRYEQLNQKDPQIEREETPEVLPEGAPEKPVRKIGRMGFMAGIGKILSKNGGSVLGRIVQNPDDQKIEMYVDGETFRVDVKPRR